MVTIEKRRSVWRMFTSNEQTRDVGAGLIADFLFVEQGQHRGFQTAEAKIQIAAVEHRARQFELP